MIEAAISKQFPAGDESRGFHLRAEFTAQSGITVLYGPSGAGKTLTLDAIAGFIAPDAGRILLGGRIVFDAGAKVNVPPRDRGCGYVFQNYALFPHMTLRQNLAFAAHQLPRLERHRRIADLLERFRLTEFAGRYPRELSGGQKQRGSIARALIAAPRILLLDEPGRGLDASLRGEFHTLIRTIGKSLESPVLLVTHDLEECFALADHVLIYDQGNIVHRGSPLDLLRNPGTATVARLLGDFNIYDAEVLSLDPARQSSRVRMLGHELTGPHLRACFKGDRIRLCARPEDLRLAAKPGPNRIRVESGADGPRIVERPQSVRADFGDELIVDIARPEWADHSTNATALWVEIPAESLRQIS